MTQVVINEEKEKYGRWFQQLTISIPEVKIFELSEIKSINTAGKTEFINKEKSLILKIKEFFFKKYQNGDKLIPVIPIKRVKSRVYTEIAQTNGANSFKFRIN
ncbi:MAG: hypothetical protein ACTSWY_04860 [Promethearchaeota archaeon]